MKALSKLFVFLGLLSACGQHDVLTDNNWILIGGTFQGKTIDFKCTDLIVLTDPQGEIIRSLNFNEDQTVILPGINSGNIRARWTIQGNEILFSIDSMKYPYSSFDPSIFNPGDTTVNRKVVNELIEFEEAMRVYGHLFEYDVSHDTLKLSSKDVKLWAVRDRRIDDMFKNL